LGTRLLPWSSFASSRGRPCEKIAVVILRIRICEVVAEVSGYSWGYGRRHRARGRLPSGRSDLGDPVHRGATRNWLPGKKVLVSPGWIQRISWRATVSCIPVAASYPNAPEYREGMTVTRQYEQELYSQLRSCALLGPVMAANVREDGMPMTEDLRNAHLRGNLGRPKGRSWFGGAVGIPRDCPMWRSWFRKRRGVDQEGQALS